MSIRIETQQVRSASQDVSKIKMQLNVQLEVVERVSRELDSRLKARAGIDGQLHRLKYALESKVRQLERLEKHLVTVAKDYETVENKVCKLLGEAQEDYEKALNHKAWYEGNLFKFAVGTAVIVGLGIAAFTIGGPVLIGMAVGAAIGAGVGGLIGGITSKMSGGNFWDGAADGWMVGSISGAISGGVSGSGAGLLGAVTADGLVDSGVYTYEAFKNGEQVTAAGLATSFAVGAGFSFLGTKASGFITKQVAAKSAVSQVDDVVEGVGKAINFKVLNETPADEVNNWWLKVMNYTEPPYKPGTIVKEIELTDESTFVRVFDGVNSGQTGGWIMNAEDILGLSPKQIQAKFALPHTPTQVTDVVLEAGTKLRTGTVNPLFGQPGEGIQFDLMGQRVGQFINVRLLN